MTAHPTLDGRGRQVSGQGELGEQRLGVGREHLEQHRHADQRGHPDDMFFGAKSIYDRAGFREVARRKPTRPVVRKSLRPRRA